MRSHMPSASSQQEITCATLQVPLSPGQTDEQALAAQALSAILPSAITARFFAAPSFGALDINSSVQTLRDACHRAMSGNLSDMETMLAAQAYALNNIFGELARMALVNIGQNSSVFDGLMRLAFKAQAQCRCTTLALAEIQHPRSTSFVKQTNIAQGHQQVNNCPYESVSGEPPSENPENPTKRTIG
ncbi:hypothetical protein [Silvimonas amylolytica]|uniref:Phasin domain-containing protein n=1 Tax=Silvimonas amylolytica TaxID=449663 RepID=A0ABQ2PHT3_9NEIS|nr:hypothetical protein [Silvimonas amylolytica]GGP24834.1 hypothetical protein GCM10010971_06530 [Silvimonas amylolytica]